MKYQKVAIVYRPDLEDALIAALEVVDWLKQNNAQAFTAPDQKLLKGTKKLAPAQIKQMDLLVSIGGDGTYLRASRLLNGLATPILGVNLGSLGFLTTTRRKDMIDHLKKTFDNKMKLCPRSVLEVLVKRKNKSTKTILCLNDVVIERGARSQLINIDIYSGGFLVSDIKADGLIIASPTGSTAYNLAAGGPILHPETKALVVTAIAPHSLTARPFIFPDDQELSFKLHTKTEGANLIIDGHKESDLLPTDEVFIKRHSTDHLMVREKNHNYFHLLREKLKFGDRS